MGIVHAYFENSKVAGIAEKLASKIGVEERPWNTLTHLTLYTFMFTTLVGCWFRADYFGITFSISCLIMLFSEEYQTERSYFFMALASLFSLMYDCFHLMMITENWYKSIPLTIASSTLLVWHMALCTFLFMLLFNDYLKMKQMTKKAHAYRFFQTE